MRVHVWLLPLGVAALAGQNAIPPMYETPRRPAPVVAPAAAPRAAAAAPVFRVVSRSGAMGQAMTARLATVTSGRVAMRNALGAAGVYFDGPLTLVGAFGDARDQQMQAIFRASYKGTPVTGFAMAAVAAGDTRAAVVFDQVAQVARSFPVLLRALGAGEAAGAAGGASGGGMAAPQPLTRTMFPDGSGAIGLPAGWRIGSSFKGIVDASGPQGQMVVFGYYQQVMTSWMGQRPAIPGFMSGPYREPAMALATYVDSYTNGAISRGQATYRMIEQSPVASPNGRAAYISYEVQAQGKSAIGLALVSTAPVDSTTWVYYMSSVAAPRERFGRDFPTMWAMWKSWSVNPAVFRERMDAALQSMRETHRILQESYANTQRTYDRVNHAWSQTIRGVTTIEHIGTGWRGDVDTNYVDRLVRGLNDQGWDWRVVPMRDLLP